MGRSGECDETRSKAGGEREDDVQILRLARLGLGATFSDEE